MDIMPTVCINQDAYMYMLEQTLKQDPPTKPKPTPPGSTPPPAQSIIPLDQDILSFVKVFYFLLFCRTFKLSDSYIYVAPHSQW